MRRESAHEESYTRRDIRAEGYTTLGGTYIAGTYIRTGIYILTEVLTHGGTYTRVEELIHKRVGTHKI